MVRTKIIITDETFKNWINGFKKQKTKNAYSTGLRTFKKNLGIEDLGEYLKGNIDAIEDLKRFSVSLEGKASLTIRQYVGAIRVFFMDHDVKIDENGWNKAKKRGFIQKKARAMTRDKIPTKAELKRILNYTSIQGKALILFLLSSGARVGETLQLEKKDFDLEATPPNVFIRKEITKADVGERTVFFSFEARDSIKDWLSIKDSMGKRDGTTYEGERVFGFSYDTAKGIWNRAIRKAGLDAKDKNTNHRLYHLHSLRKFFRSRSGLELDMIHSLMGHSEYLDNSYLRQDQETIAKAYLENMKNVSVYEGTINQELRKKADKNEEENRTLRKEVATMKIELRTMRSMMQQILEKLPEGN